MTIAVIGAGLFGAAAARHLAKAGAEVVLIGPDEPDDWATHDGPFASHYDEGRITRRVDGNPFWIAASTAAIARYPEIEAESGIAFHTPCGQLTVVDQGSDAAARLEAAGVASLATRLDQGQMQERFPYFHFRPERIGWYEENGAGHISPRRLVRAQITAAKRHGAHHLAQSVTAVRDTGSEVVITTAQGTLTAKHAIVAAGGWSGHLLNRAQDFHVRPRTVALFELSPDEAARLAAMPSLIYDRRDAGEPYLLPPIRYPDGKTYLKLGGDTMASPLQTPEDLTAWYQSGGADWARDQLTDWITRLIPDLSVEQVHMAPCVTCLTPSGLPLIERHSDTITLCAGGNGAGAKNSDELGRRGAMLALAATQKLQETHA